MVAFRFTEPNMHGTQIAEFIGLSVLVFIAAWEPPATWLRKAAHIRRKAVLFGALWLIIAVMYWWLFRLETNAWSSLFFLVELGGITYLGKEVNIAQAIEQYKMDVRRDLIPFLQLDHLIDEGKLDEYVAEYDKMDLKGHTQAEVDSHLAERRREIGVAKVFGTFEALVKGLRESMHRSIENPESVAFGTMKYRRNRLRLGVAMVGIALVAHGAHTLSESDDSDLAYLREAIANEHAQFVSISARLATLERRDSVSFQAQSLRGSPQGANDDGGGMHAGDGADRGGQRGQPRDLPDHP
jgi:hypothetical protein